VLPPDTAIYWSPADNNEMMTRSRIQEYLVQDLRLEYPEIHSKAGEKGSPRLFFIERSDLYPQGCYHCIDQMKNQRRVKIGTDMGEAVFSDERDDKVPDHAYDTIRYEIGSRPPIAVAMPQKASKGSFNAVHAQMIRDKRDNRDKALARLAKIGQRRSSGYRS
jgi:hypothetical protein